MHNGKVIEYYYTRYVFTLYLLRWLLSHECQSGPVFRIFIVKMLNSTFIKYADCIFILYFLRCFISWGAKNAWCIVQRFVTSCTFMSKWETMHYKICRLHFNAMLVTFLFSLEALLTIRVLHHRHQQYVHTIYRLHFPAIPDALLFSLELLRTAGANTSNSGYIIYTIECI